MQRSEKFNDKCAPLELVDDAWRDGLHPILHDDQPEQLQVALDIGTRNPLRFGERHLYRATSHGNQAVPEVIG